jgi:hypothetical protein
LAAKAHEKSFRDVYTGMSTPSWSATLRLAALVSLVAAAVAMVLAQFFAEPVVIGSVIAGASLVGWMHADGLLSLKPARVRRR